MVTMLWSTSSPTELIGRKSSPSATNIWVGGWGRPQSVTAGNRVDCPRCNSLTIGQTIQIESKAMRNWGLGELWPLSCLVKDKLTLHFHSLSTNKYIMHLKSSTCSGHLPIQVQAPGYCNTQSLTTSMALITMRTAKCSLFLQHKYVVYLKFKSSGDMNWLVGPAILALLYSLPMPMWTIKFFIFSLVFC
jgi:hypothetical protein